MEKHRKADGRGPDLANDPVRQLAPLLRRLHEEGLERDDLGARRAAR